MWEACDFQVVEKTSLGWLWIKPGTHCSWVQGQLLTQAQPGGFPLSPLHIDHSSPAFMERQLHPPPPWALWAPLCAQSEVLSSQGPLGSRWYLSLLGHHVIQVLRVPLGVAVDHRVGF